MMPWILVVILVGVPGVLFDELGFRYFGPIDGHDIKSMVKILENLKNGSHEKPMLLHVVTEKGRGHPFSKGSHEKYHAVSEFNVITGDTVKAVSNAPTYTNVFSETLCKIAEKDKRIMAITAAMPSGTGLNKFAEKLVDKLEVDRPGKQIEIPFPEDSKDDSKDKISTNEKPHHKDMRGHDSSSSSTGCFSNII